MKTRLRIFGAALATLGAAASASAAPIPEKKSGSPTMSMIAKKMDKVADSLGEILTGLPVQTRQQSIIQDLDVLIADLEKQCQACRNGIASNRPMRPASGPHGGTGGVGDLVEPGTNDKEWAKLSPRERDRILQSMSEGFPPEYRTVLERYYRRLAEEQAAATPAPAAEADEPIDAFDDAP